MSRQYWSEFAEELKELARGFTGVGRIDSKGV